MKKYEYTKSFSFDGKRYRVYGNTLEEAIEKKALKIRDLEQGRVTISGAMKVSEWVDRCLLAYKPNVSENYLSQMKGRIDKHILSEIGNLPVKSIKPLQCQAILNAQSDMSKSHIIKLHQELCFIFEKAVENKIILENPAAHLVRPQGHEGHRRSLTEKERTHFLKVCEKEPRFILFEFMLYCGCRPSEAMGLQGMDIEEKNGRCFLHIRGTKTANADRLVPLPDVLRDKVVNVSPFDYLAKTKANTPHSRTSYKRLTERLKREMNLSMGCRSYRSELLPPFPLADDFTPYILRHTYCTDLQKKGIDVRVAQKLMGHADIRTTANIYTHQDMETLESAYDILSGNTRGNTHPDDARKTVNE